MARMTNKQKQRKKNASKAGKASHKKGSNRGKIVYEGDAMGGD